MKTSPSPGEQNKNSPWLPHFNILVLFRNKLVLSGSSDVYLPNITKVWFPSKWYIFHYFFTDRFILFFPCPIQNNNWWGAPGGQLRKLGCAITFGVRNCCPQPESHSYMNMHTYIERQSVLLSFCSHDRVFVGCEGHTTLKKRVAQVLFRMAMSLSRSTHDFAHSIQSWICYRYSIYFFDV